MIDFSNDYLAGCAPEILERLNQTNLEETIGYGEDAHCLNAARLIREACQAESAAVHFAVGGTQANALVIRSVLRPHQGVISASSGHIAVHEAGAVEAGGHKVLEYPVLDGKLAAAQIRQAAADHFGHEDTEHKVQPKLVYISQPTEVGTLYSGEELLQLRAACDAAGFYLFIDGARLGYGLAAADDLDLPAIAALADVFTIGGTKLGALFGEAIVLVNPALQPDFRYILKQSGAMLAKGRLLGIQFETLFQHDLYARLSRQGIRTARRIREALSACGIPQLFASPTNQLFPVFTARQLAKLEQNFVFTPWQNLEDGRAAVRICTSWSTREAAVGQLIAALRAL